MDDTQQLKSEILRLTRLYASKVHSSHLPASDPKREVAGSFLPGQTTIPYAGRVFDEDEVEAAVGATLDFWLTLGPEGQQFERELANCLGVSSSLLVNSGSSANLLAISALTSPSLGERQLRPGDEVITAAAGFPTTVAPIVQQGCVPVFLDSDPATLNICVGSLEEAYRPGITKAVMLAHTLGNPFDLSSVVEFCKRHGLWLIEDNCDALGSFYDNKPTGSFGDLSTQSFYPPHHMTLGEGGAVNIPARSDLGKLAESFRDWGRACWCPSGKDNTCHKRYGWKLGDLPEGYDHKYVYNHLGYNLKPLDIQAAIGRQQLKKLPGFVQARRENWEILRTQLADLGEYLDFMLPTHATAWTPNGFEWDATGHRSDCSWFGFMMRVKSTAPFGRRELVECLDAARIGNRMLFGGNLVRQPAFTNLIRQRPDAFRVIGDLAGADQIMKDSLFIGVYPGLTKQMLAYMVETIQTFCRRQH